MYNYFTRFVRPVAKLKASLCNCRSLPFEEKKKLLNNDELQIKYSVFSRMNQEAFFTAKTLHSPRDDFKVPDLPDEVRLPDIGPSIHKMTELIRQLQAVDEQEQDLIKEILDMDPDLEHSKGIFKKRKPSIPDQKLVQLQSKRQESLELTRQTLEIVRKARGLLSLCLSSVVHTRALQFATTVSPAPSLTELQTEGHHLPYLLGRCFNLSLNLKILQDCCYCDHGIAGRCYADLSVLDDHLNKQCLRLLDSSVLEDLQNAKKKKRTASTTEEIEKNFTSALKLKPVRRLLKLNACSSKS